MVDPDDGDLMDGLRSAPPAAWRTLWASVDALGAVGLDSVWRGGDTDGHVPFVEYSVELAEVVVALYEVRAVAPFDWMAWYDEQRYPDGVGLEEAPIDDVVRMLTAVVRADRFSEGSLKQAVDSGLFGLLVRRLREWHDTSLSAP